MISPPDYPKHILKGDVIADVFTAVQNRLKDVFPEDAFAHYIMPPNAKNFWSQITASAPAVALGMNEWRADAVMGRNFRGRLCLPVAILLQMTNPADLYLGTGRLREMGLAGIFAALAGAVHGWTIPNAGTCEIKNMNVPDGSDWFTQNQAMVLAEINVTTVALNNQDTLAALDQFAGLSARIRMENEKCS